MLERCFDPRVVNALVNHPDIRPHVGPGDEELELAEVVARPENYFLLGEYGGFAVLWTAPRTYEIHTFVLQDGRGVWASRIAQEMLAFMRMEGARLMWTKVPPGRRNVEVFTRRAGLRTDGQTVDTFGLPYVIYYKEF